MGMCKCCGKEYDYKRQTGNSKTYCSSCMCNRQRFRKIKELREMFGGKCQICGYDKHQSALQFHHNNPKEKLFQISGSTSRSMSSLISEAKKCILVCANCHAEINTGSPSRSHFHNNKIT